MTYIPQTFPHIKPDKSIQPQNGHTKIISTTFTLERWESLSVITV